MKQINLIATFAGGTVLFVFALTCWLFEDRSPISVAPLDRQSELTIREVLRRSPTMAQIVPKGGPESVELAIGPASAVR